MPESVPRTVRATPSQAPGVLASRTNRPSRPSQTEPGLGRSGGQDKGPEPSEPPRAGRRAFWRGGQTARAGRAGRRAFWRGGQTARMASRTDRLSCRTGPSPAICSSVENNLLDGAANGAGGGANPPATGDLFFGREQRPDRGTNRPGRATSRPAVARAARRRHPRRAVGATLGPSASRRRCLRARATCRCGRGTRAAA